MTWEIRTGHVLELLAQVPDDSVQCVTTSPPFWGLRDYGTPPQVWGGDPAHEHEFADETVEREMRRGINLAASAASTRGGGHKIATVPNQVFVHGFCSCGAWRGSLGLEPTPDLYVEHIVAIFREVRRVLRKDGTLWLNMGDCYATGAGKVGDCPGGGDQGERWKKYGPARAQVPDKKNPDAMVPTFQPNRMPIPGLKPKDLVGMPWRIAFALQADGWWLRRDIIWSKPNCMPESADDRPTTAHEYLFLLSKSARYYYDAGAIAEPVTGNAHPRGDGVNPKAEDDIPLGWDTGPGNHHGKVGRYKAVSKTSAFRVDRIPKPRRKQNRSFSAAVTGLVEKRNKRSVWTIATQPFAEAHFATFPEALVEPCVLAGSAPGNLVLDPFSGSGTVGVVALRHGRHFLGLELSPAYSEMSRRRIAGPLFAEVDPKREEA